MIRFQINDANFEKLDASVTISDEDSFIFLKDSRNEDMLNGTNNLFSQCGVKIIEVFKVYAVHK